MDNKWIHEIQSDAFLNYTVTADFPHLEIEAEKYDKLLASDKQRRLDLDATINLTKNEEGVFGDLSDYLFAQMAKTHQRQNNFDVFNLWSWLSVIQRLWR